MNTGERGHGRTSANTPSLSPMDVLNAARKAVPAVDYALGAAGIAAAGSIVIFFLGNGRAAIIVLSGMFVAMILLFVFSRLVSAGNKATIKAGITLMWMVIAFTGVFLLFTVTAVAFGQPEVWADVLGLSRKAKVFDKQAMDDLLKVPNEITSRIADKGSAIALVRLQPRLEDQAQAGQREAVLRGAGTYYSFVRRTHAYGFGSDIALNQGMLKTGFAGADYGFFMFLGQSSVETLTTIGPNNPPDNINSTQRDAWDFMWSYQPPSDIKLIRKEQRRAEGFPLNGTSLSSRVVLSKGGLYLLRSIQIGDSDILVALFVVDILTDNSVVLAWRPLKIFDTPISTGAESSG